jgi:hypothetical protein
MQVPASFCHRVRRDQHDPADRPGPRRGHHRGRPRRVPPRLMGYRRAIGRQHRPGHDFAEGASVSRPGRSTSALAGSGFSHFPAARQLTASCTSPRPRSGARTGPNRCDPGRPGSRRTLRWLPSVEPHFRGSAAGRRRESGSAEDPVPHLPSPYLWSWPLRKPAGAPICSAKPSPCTSTSRARLGPLRLTGRQAPRAIGRR